MNIIPLLILFVYCDVSHNPAGTDKPMPAPISITPCPATLRQDSVSWIDNFKKFRTAISRADVKTVRSFFDFPVIDERNEIWYWIFQDDKAKPGLSAKNSKPFLARDLDRYFSRLFPKKFVDCIMKLKPAELNKTGESETVPIKDGANATYKMYATVDTATRTLQLNLSFHVIEKDKKGNIENTEEYGTIYVFDLLDNGQLKFKKIGLTA